MMTRDTTWSNPNSRTKRQGEAAKQHIAGQWGLQKQHWSRDYLNLIMTLDCQLASLFTN